MKIAHILLISLLLVSTTALVNSRLLGQIHVVANKIGCGLNKVGDSCKTNGSYEDYDSVYSSEETSDDPWIAVYDSLFSPEEKLVTSNKPRINVYPRTSTSMFPVDQGVYNHVFPVGDSSETSVSYEDYDSEETSDDSWIDVHSRIPTSMIPVRRGGFNYIFRVDRNCPEGYLDDGWGTCREMY